MVSALLAAGDFVKKGSCHTARIRRGKAQLSGYKLTNWRAVLASALWTLEGHRTSDEELAL